MVLTMRLATDRSLPRPTARRKRQRRKPMTDTSGNWFARLSRRSVLGGIAFGTAALAAGGNRNRVVLAQGATPTACLEPIDTSRLDMIKTVPEGTKLAIAIVPKGVHPFFEDTRKGGDEEATKLGDVDFQWV